MLSKVLLASLAANLAAAISCSSDVSVASQADLDAMQSCTTIGGNLNINTDITTATFNNLKTVTGDFNIGAIYMTSLAAPLLNAIGGTFNMTSMIVLATCSFPSLKTVGNIHWQTLPALDTLAFDQTITSASEVYISDTRLSTLTGINLMTVDIFNINNNRQLTNVTVQLANVTNSLDISFNGMGVQANFPNMIWANNATFRDCASVSTPVLKAVNGSLGFDNNTLTSYSAPVLATVGQAVSFADNSALTNVSMPKLTAVGGTLQLANNTMLKIIDGFPSVKTVGGAVDFSGNFTNATLPALTDVKGGFNLQTSAQFDCSTFDAEKGNVIEGNSYVCQGAVADPGTQGSTPTSTSSGSGSSATSKSAAVENVVSPYGLWAGLAIIGSLVL